MGKLVQESSLGRNISGLLTRSTWVGRSPAPCLRRNSLAPTAEKPLNFPLWRVTWRRVTGENLPSHAPRKTARKVSGEPSCSTTIFQTTILVSPAQFAINCLPRKVSESEWYRRMKGAERKRLTLLLTLLCLGSLQRHKSVHRDKTKRGKLKPRTHKCDTCSRCFPQKINLREHQITHIPKNERDKPFKCTVCPKRFSKGSSLRAHKDVHKETRDSKCHLCERGFLRKSQLRYHLVSAHKFNYTEATTKANIQTKTKERLPTVSALHGAGDSASAPGEPHEDFQPGTSCPICFKAHSRPSALSFHLKRDHGKSHVEAKTMTELDGTKTNPSARKLFCSLHNVILA